jgi:hypothetical protein
VCVAGYLTQDLVYDLPLSYTSTSLLYSFTVFSSPEEFREDPDSSSRLIKIA